MEHNDNFKDSKSGYIPPQKPISDDNISNQISSVETVKKIKDRKSKEYYELVYELYIQWLVIPEALKEPDEIKEYQFANKYKIDRKTLWNFAKRVDFGERLKKANKDISQKKLQYMKNAIFNTGVVMGKPEAQKLYLQLEDGFKDKTETDINVNNINLDKIMDKIKQEKVNKNEKNKEVKEI